MNRIERAQAALNAYVAVVGGGLSHEEYLTDLMTDLLHLCDADGEDQDFSAESVLRSAEMHRDAERGDWS